MSARIPGIPDWVYNDGFDPIYEYGNDDGVDVIRTTSEAPRLRSAEELARAIKAAGGRLIIRQDSSELIVAVNNQFRFSVENLGNGTYAIKDRLAGNTSSVLIIAVAAIALLLAMSGGSGRR